MIYVKMVAEICPQPKVRFTWAKEGHGRSTKSRHFTSLWDSILKIGLKLWQLVNEYLINTMEEEHVGLLQI